jgi:hypothetical protein
MSDTVLWIGLAVGELLMIVFLALLVSWLRNLAMRRRDRKAVESLVAHSRGRKDERMAEIGDFLGSKYALEGEAHGYAVRALYKAEARLIQAFARTYLHRDAKAASRFHKPVEDGVGEYWSLETGVEKTEGDGDGQAMEAAMAEASEAEAAEAEGDDGELERLRKENQSLSDELRLTMDTMGRMLNEYSSVFAKDAELGNIQVIGGEAELDGDSEALAAESVAVDEETLPEEGAAADAAEPVAEPVAEEVTEEMAEGEPAAVTEEAAPEPAEADDIDAILQASTGGEVAPEAGVEIAGDLEVSAGLSANEVDLSEAAEAGLPAEEAITEQDAAEAKGEVSADEDVEALLEELDKRSES